jgi:small-conductance mechanosensitive channel
LDDVLVPLLTRRVIPLGTFVGATVVALGVLGVNLIAVLTALGAISFLLIFLFQDPLSNLFGGVYLVMDVPFKYGDLVVLEDEKTYRVDDIGVRVTRLYNTSDHTVAYIPNSKLAGQRIVNLTRPNVELRMKMPVGVAYGTADLSRVQELLIEVANGHPYVLGDADAKLKAMAKRLTDVSDVNEKTRLAIEIERITVESSIRYTCEQLLRRLQFLSQFVHSLERGGLDLREREAISAVIDSLWRMVAGVRRQLTIWLHLVGRADATYKWSGNVMQLTTAAELDQLLPSIDKLEEWRKMQTVPNEIKMQLLSNGNLAVLGTLSDVDEEFYLAGSRAWIEFSREVKSRGVQASMDKSLATWMKEQPAWSTFKDYHSLYESWHKPVCDLIHHIEACHRITRSHSDKEFQLDDAVMKVVNLVEEKFLLTTPGWQRPDADFIGFGASSIDFQLELFVDDLVRGHFERAADVFSELGVEIVRRFKQEGIEIPSPQTEVWFKDQWLKESLQKLKESGGKGEGI